LDFVGKPKKKMQLDGFPLSNDTI